MVTLTVSSETDCDLRNGCLPLLALGAIDSVGVAAARAIFQQTCPIQRADGRLNPPFQPPQPGLHQHPTDAGGQIDQRCSLLEGPTDGFCPSLLGGSEDAGEIRCERGA